MNLIERLEHTGQSYELGVCDEAAAMLRKQHEAIRQLREALLKCKHEAGVPEHVYKTAKAALAATEALI
jgi:hypothetical protein